MSQREFKVTTMPNKLLDRTDVVLVLDGTTLNPAVYDDWVLGGRYLKGVRDSAGNFDTWVSWSKQAGSVAFLTTEDYLKRWKSIGVDTISGAWPTPSITTPPAAQSLSQPLPTDGADLANTPRNAIAAILDKYTNDRCGLLYVEDISELQNALTDLMAPPPTPAPVLEAKGHTLIDLVSLGLLTDEDMANHLADCAESLTGQRFTAKRIMDILHGLRGLQDLVYGLNEKAGWWSDLETGEPKVRNKGELMMLMVTEIAEGYEGVRRNLTDDKLKYRPMEEVELADMVIRGVDYTGGHKFDIGGAILHKLLFNQLRADHKRDARLGANGKKT